MQFDIARLLRAHRKARKLTQRAVAQAIGHAQSTINGWEKGDRGVDLKDLKKLADFYGVSVAVLLSAPDATPQAEQAQEAADLGARLDSEAFQDWMRLGRRLERKASAES